MRAAERSLIFDDACFQGWAPNQVNFWFVLFALVARQACHSPPPASSVAFFFLNLSSSITLFIMATPQPDLRVLSDSLVEAGHQISLLPNMPAIDNERYLRDQFTALRQGIDEQFRLLRVDLDTRFEQVNTRFEQVNTRFEQVDTRFQNLELSMKSE